jgi:hypothetical protein
MAGKTTEVAVSLPRRAVGEGSSTRPGQGKHDGDDLVCVCVGGEGELRTRWQGHHRRQLEEGFGWPTLEELSYERETVITLFLKVEDDGWFIG